MQLTRTLAGKAPANTGISKGLIGRRIKRADGASYADS